MSLKGWMNIDIDNLDLLEVTDIEKARVKRHVLKKYKKALIWRNVAIASFTLFAATVTTGFAFPSLASQIPFLDNVIRYFYDEEQQINNFTTFSTDIGLVETSNGITVMIDHAVYDGTNITVSYAIETEHPFGENMDVVAPHWFDVEGAIAMGGTGKITKVSNTQYVGIATLTPQFKKDEYPETIQVTWEPTAFTNHEEVEIEGDWSFAFSLDRLEGTVALVNKTVQDEDLTFTLQSVEYTPVSTVISYKQIVTDELLEKWESVTPVFRVTDDLGNEYLNELGGGGTSSDNGKTFSGTTEFGTIKEGASELIIQPVEIASDHSGEGHIEIELEPIVIDLKK